MKILRPGRSPVEWYFRKAFACFACEAVVQLEPGDSFSTYPGDQREGPFVSFVCPTCGDKMYGYP